MSLAFMDELESRVGVLEHDESVRAVVVTGAGAQNFSVGHPAPSHTPPTANARTPALKLAAEIPAGGICGSGRLCWKETSRGFKYTSKFATPDGVLSLTLKEGFEGNAAITLKATGVHLPMPTLPLAQDPTVTVQLTNDKGLLGICWDADDEAPALKNVVGEFRDKGG